MLTLLRDLFRHQEWADIALLEAVREGAPSDETLAGLLHHIATVERFFHTLLTDQVFDKQAELASPRDLPSLEASLRQAHAGLDAFLDSLDEPGLERGISVHWFPGHTLPVRDILLQVVMHSQNHRGQCLTRLRELAGKAPTLDYILWAKDHHK